VAKLATLADAASPEAPSLFRANRQRKFTAARQQRCRRGAIGHRCDGATSQALRRGLACTQGAVPRQDNVRSVVVDLHRTSSAVADHRAQTAAVIASLSGHRLAFVMHEFRAACGPSAVRARKSAPGLCPDRRGKCAVDPHCMLITASSAAAAIMARTLSDRHAPDLDFVLAFEAGQQRACGGSPISENTSAWRGGQPSAAPGNVLVMEDGLLCPGQLTQLCDERSLTSATLTNRRGYLRQQSLLSEWYNEITIYGNLRGEFFGGRLYFSSMRNELC